MESSAEKLKVKRFVNCCMFLVALGFAPDSNGQSLRYIDSSGNVRFADSIKDVPREYREQIYPATPTPVLTRQEQAQKRMQEERMMREKLQREQMKRMERERRGLDADKAARKRQYERHQDELSSGFKPGAF